MVEQWPIYSGSIGAIVLVALLLLRILRQESRGNRVFWTMADYELRVSKREARVCNRRLEMVIGACRKAQVAIPDDIWTKPEADEPPIPMPEGMINGQRDGRN